MYLTAATFFATLTGVSPVGAAVPAGELVPFMLPAVFDEKNGTEHAGGGGGGVGRGDSGGKIVRLPVIDAADGAAAQRIAQEVVGPGSHCSNIFDNTLANLVSRVRALD